MVVLHCSITLQLQMIELKMIVLQLYIISIYRSHVLLVVDMYIDLAASYIES